MRSSSIPHAFYPEDFLRLAESPFEKIPASNGVMKLHA